MFVDKAKIYVKGGDGGDGAVSFRREKYVAEGGPAGGDGGRGGDVIFRVDEGLRTLMDFRYQRHFKADRGEHGKTKGRYGANADSLVVRVPPGTVVIEEESQLVLADLTKQGQEAVIARGGRGGRGNIKFASPSNPAPEIAENGEAGEERWVFLELKLLADVGLVGFPSVGKSSLLSVVSAARPKIAEYHFTTLSPNLGVVDVGDGRHFVMADLPGLIEGAHTGMGLGHEFLRHIERTRVILHVIDMASTEGRDPFDDYLAIRSELENYNPKLLACPQLIVANKMDVEGALEQLVAFRERAVSSGIEHPICEISTVTKYGIQQLLYRTMDILADTPAFPLVDDVADEEERVVYRLRQEQQDGASVYEIRRENETYVVVSAAIEKLMKRTNFRTEQSIMRFAHTLRKMGIDQALRERGAKDGDLVRIGHYEFEFVEFDEK